MKMLVRNLRKRNPQRKVENKKNFTFIGLWNPQKKYEKTRHNIGADCLVKLSEKNNISLKTHKSGKFQLGSYEEDGYEIDIVIPMVSSVIISSFCLGLSCGSEKRGINPVIV